jgi:hypothetical protein
MDRGRRRIAGWIQVSLFTRFHLKGLCVESEIKASKEYCVISVKKE